MKDESCRHCGAELEVNKKCEFCNNPVQFFCHACGGITDEQIHSQCMLENNEKSFAVTN